jgi:hypothetical protein
MSPDRTGLASARAVLGSDHIALPMQRSDAMAVFSGNLIEPVTYPNHSKEHAHVG